MPLVNLEKGGVIVVYIKRKCLKCSKILCIEEKGLDTFYVIFKSNDTKHSYCHALIILYQAIFPFKKYLKYIFGALQ